MELAGRRALVTGAGSAGIGRAVTLALAHAGADLAVTHLAQDEAAGALVRTIEALGRRAVALEADLSDPGRGAGAGARRGSTARWARHRGQLRRDPGPGAAARDHR
jgi:NAD(P)-dependent dehydrogenase (short-subunit alcohol dehydrogenase family)